MYADLDADLAWAARANVDYALEALAVPGTPSWVGVAAANAAAVQGELLERARGVRDLVHAAAAQAEELDALRAVALREVL